MQKELQHARTYPRTSERTVGKVTRRKRHESSVTCLHQTHFMHAPRIDQTGSECCEVFASFAIKFFTQGPDMNVPTIGNLLRKRNTQWYVIDIFLSGKYSELAKQRAEYTSVLNRKGFIGLVDIVEEKIQRMAQLGN